MKRLETMNEIGSDDEKTWAANVIRTLNKSSPISLVVTIEQIKRGITIKSKEDAYNLEAQLVAAFVEDSDFFEGVRSLLVDKDLKSNWKHKSYKEINQKELIKRFFDRAEEINVDPEKEN